MKKRGKLVCYKLYLFRKYSCCQSAANSHDDDEHLVAQLYRRHLEF